MSLAGAAHAASWRSNGSTHPHPPSVWHQWRVFIARARSAQCIAHRGDTGEPRPGRSPAHRLLGHTSMREFTPLTEHKRPFRERPKRSTSVSRCMATGCRNASASVKGPPGPAGSTAQAACPSACHVMGSRRVRSRARPPWAREWSARRWRTRSGVKRPIPATDDAIACRASWKGRTSLAG